MPRILSPPLSPHVALQISVQVPSWQANDHLEPMNEVAEPQGFAVPSVSEISVLIPEKAYSHDTTFSIDFERFLESSRNVTTLAQHILATDLQDMPDEVTWSEKELRFLAQHRKVLGICQEGYHGLPALNSPLDNSELPNPSLKRCRPMAFTLP